MKGDLQTTQVAPEDRHQLDESALDRFGFGRNWQRFIDRHLTDERVARARMNLSNFLGFDSMTGKVFLDIGCGSGLFSYVAHQMGASKVISFDYDADSVAATKLMWHRAGSPETWSILQGSVLDEEFMSTIDPADVVYSWGVLHHTGSMWRAIERAAGKVRPGGYFYIAIYNKQEYATLQSIRGSHYWLKVKKLYVRGGWPARLMLEGFYRSIAVSRMLLSLRNPLTVIRNYQSLRGMSWSVDMTDWLGGLPYEFASPEEIFRFCRDRFGFDLCNLFTSNQLGCNQFLFQRPKDSKY